MKHRVLKQLIGIIQPIFAARLIGYNGNINNSPSVPLQCANKLLSSNWFKPSLPTIFYAHGFNGQVTDAGEISIANNLYNTYHGQRNIILVDWKQEASQGGLDSYVGYVLHAIPGAVYVGTKLGLILADLVLCKGVNQDIQIIGHSLGAQLAGICGAKTLALGYTIPRITGLDPAGPVFNEDTSFKITLDASDGLFVDIYHTNPGSYGMDFATGDVDVWFNYSPVFPVEQPGCENATSNVVGGTSVDRCSHERSVTYFADSIFNPSAFIASKAVNFTAWQAGQTSGSIIVGQFIDTNCDSGNYYLTTSGTPPYGRGIKGAVYCFQ